MLGVRNFNHHAGCQKCDTRGNFSHGTMSFPSKIAGLRTDSSFRTRLDPDHHIKYSIIEELIGFDCVLDFPISDPLHLFHIGVSKKMLNRWLNGTKTYKKLITKLKLSEIDNLLRLANQCKPTEINRPIRITKDFPRWKATEHRTILLYAGIVILKDLIPVKDYELFLLLSCAMKLASVEKYFNVNNRIILIENLLKDFVQNYAKLYGKHTITSNIHNLLHVSNDLKCFGNIDSISTYPFENHLGKVKQKIRAYHHPIQQFAKRVGELENFQVIDINVPKKEIELKHSNDDSFQTIIMNDFQLSSRKVGDKWFMSADKIIKYEKTIRNGNEIFIHGKEIPDKHVFFEYPYDSIHNDIYISNCIEQDSIVCTPDEIKCKLFRLPYKENYVFQPLLHTL